MRTVIFDLDGTLADTSGDLLAAANACFRAMGAGDVLTASRDAGVALRGGRAMLLAGLTRLGRDGAGLDGAGLDEAGLGQEIDRWYPVLLEEYEGALDRHTVLYPGAVAALEALLAEDFRIGVCTNKPERMAQKLLVSLGVRDLFGSLVGADTLPVRKPDPAPYAASVERAGGTVARSILIGDSDTDRATARAAGVASVLVTFGPSGDDMAALEPEVLLDRYEDLPGVARDLLGAGQA